MHHYRLGKRKIKLNKSRKEGKISSKITNLRDLFVSMYTQKPKFGLFSVCYGSVLYSVKKDRFCAVFRVYCGEFVKKQTKTKSRKHIKNSKNNISKKQKKYLSKRKIIKSR